MRKSTAKIFSGCIHNAEKLGGINDNTYGLFFPPILDIVIRLKPGTISLVKGAGDLNALGIYLAASNCWNGSVYYWKGSVIPELDNFVSLITQLQPQTSCKLTASYSNNVQYFPLHITNVPPHRGFFWQVTDPFFLGFLQIFQMENKPLIDTFIQTPSLIFFSGYDLYEISEQQQMSFKDLCKHGCAIVLVDTKASCKKFSLFDNIFTCSLRRKDQRNQRALSVKIYDKSDANYFSINIDSPDDCVFWIRRNEKYSSLRPVIEECARQKITADATIEYIATHFNIKLSSFNLARLKRKWGIRTYRKEKHPRKSKKKS